VVGPVVGLALIAGLAVWIARRRRRKAHDRLGSLDDSEEKGTGDVPIPPVPEAAGQPVAEVDASDEAQIKPPPGPKTPGPFELGVDEELLGELPAGTPRAELPVPTPRGEQLPATGRPPLRAQDGVSSPSSSG